MPFRDDIDFCCLALTGPVLADEGTQNVLPDLSVSGSTGHIDLEFWAEWLGTLQTDSFRRSSLVITAERCGHYDVGANCEVRRRIENQVRLFHFALVLLGCGYNTSVLRIGGNTASGHLCLGPISVGLTPCKQPPYRLARRITAEDLTRAAAMLITLEHVYDHAPGPDYRRIRKGFNSWIQGVEAQDPAQRLHSFVRAAEAIIRPTTATSTRRAITKTFCLRGTTFTGSSIKNQRLHCINQETFDATRRLCFVHCKLRFSQARSIPESSQTTR